MILLFGLNVGCTIVDTTVVARIFSWVYVVTSLNDVSITELIGLRRDIDNAYHRMRYSLPSSMLCATQISIGPTTYAIIPTVALMGDQDVNSSFDQVTKAINEKLLLYTEEITRSRLPLTTTATDDIIGIGSKQFISDLSDQIGRLVGDGRALAYAVILVPSHNTKISMAQLLRYLVGFLTYQIKQYHQQP